MSQNKGQTQKKGLSTALKNFFGVGDAGFVLMSNVETFYFMTFLTNFANFAPALPELDLRRHTERHQGQEVGPLSLLADSDALDRALHLHLPVHPHQRQ